MDMENTRIKEFLDEKAMEYFNTHNDEYEKQFSEFSKMNCIVGVDLASGNDFSVIDGKVIENK